MNGDTKPQQHKQGQHKPIEHKQVQHKQVQHKQVQHKQVQQETNSLALSAHILVVDDEPRLLKGLVDLLTDRGYQADAALGGSVACHMLANHAYDLVLLDLRMGDVSGHDVMDYMNKIDCDTCVVVVSGESSFSAVSRALRRGAQDYLKKPFDSDELIATVHNALYKRRLEQAHAQVQRQLRKSEELHRYIVNCSPDIVFMLDNAGHFCFLNNKVETLLGYRCSELMGRHFRNLVDDQDVAKALYALKDPTVNAQNPRSIELRLKTRGSRKENRFFEVTAFPISALPLQASSKEGDGERESVYGTLYGTARDVTERKEAEAFINFQAYHDLLTRLPNRALFKDRLELAITHAKRSNEMLAVMFLDLDRFKVINDTLGHAMGDRLLQAVSQRLESCLRKGDTLSRFGGDEFTLLLPNVASTEDVRIIARKLIDVLKQPFMLAEHQVFVGVSVGIAIYPEGGCSMDQLIQNADIAMYHVKGRGKDGYQFYTDSMNIDTSHRLGLESDLRRALDQDELCVYYQPQVSAEDGMIVGVEALVRWQHPQRGLLYPRDFLALAEETKLIGDLSERVLSIACREVREWLKQGFPDLRLAVNFSPLQVEHPRFVDTLLSQLKQHDFPPQNLEIELTENIIMNDLEQMGRKLTELDKLGIRVAIDDFGTGYSSLSYLHRLPIHTLKVDQTFIRDIREGNETGCIVDAIIAMARGLRLGIVAEGVETIAQLEYLRELGCDQVQGFFYGPAQPAHEVSLLLQEQRRGNQKRQVSLVG